MSRQRLRPGMLEASTKPCAHCHGSGIVRSDESMALSILRALEAERARGPVGALSVKAPVEIANYLINDKRDYVAAMEQRFSMRVLIYGAPDMISPDFSVERDDSYEYVPPEMAQDGAVRLDSGYIEAADEAPPQPAAEGVGDEADEGARDMRAAAAQKAEAAQRRDAADEDSEDGDDEQRGRRRGRRGGRKRKRVDEPQPDPMPVIDLAGSDAEEAQSAPVGFARNRKREEQPGGGRRGRRGARGRKSDDAPRFIDAAALVARPDALDEASALVFADAPSVSAPDAETAPKGALRQAPDENRPAAEPEREEAPLAATAPDMPAEIMEAPARPQEQKPAAKSDAPPRKGWWSRGRS